MYSSFSGKCSCHSLATTTYLILFVVDEALEDIGEGRGDRSDLTLLMMDDT